MSDEQAQQESPVSGLKAKYDELSEREQMLIKLMLGVFAALALFVVVALAQQAVMDLEEQTMQYESALSLLASQGPEYATAQAVGDDDDGEVTRADLFTDEVLRDNQVQLTSYVASHASAVDVSVSSYDVDEQPLGSSRRGDEESGPMIEERQLRADIRNADMDKLIELLHRIEESREPVVIKRIDVRSVRDEGKVRALLIVSTFQYGDEDEDS